MKRRIIKRPQFLIPMVMLSAIVLVSILGWLALRPANQPVAFSRTFVADSVKILNTGEKPKDVLDFAGNTTHHIYFQTKNPATIFVTDNQLQNGKYINIDIPTNSRINSLFKVIVDSPNINIFAGNLPGIIRVTPKQKPSVTKFSDALFTRADLISANSVALRIYDGIDQVFAKGDFFSAKLVMEKGISPKRQDAGMSTDGSLNYDKQTNQLVYVHFYNNEILCLDTNLNLIKKMKTIDNSNTSFKAGEMKYRDKITSLGPRRLVNQCSSLYNGLLFDNSTLKSAEETDQTFKNNSVIDLYSIEQGRYIGSFYLPYHKDERMKSFRVLGDKILAIYKNYLVTYTIPKVMR